MRKIKFRAYIKDINDIFLVKTIDFYKEMIQLDGKLPYDGILKLDEVTLMQYTNLKDIHRIELYEGDIVKWGHIEGGEENPIRIAVVEINPDIRFKCLNSKDIFYYGNFAYKDTEKYLEKIGDIYTTPNILDDNFIDEKCPKCGSPLLKNGIGDKWCSLVGCNYYKEGE